MHRFLYPKKMQAGETVTLSTSESHHLTKVLRIENETKVELFDGEGTLALGRVIEASKKATQIVIEKTEKREERSRIQICFGIAKTSAVEFILKRATELGVNSFQPLVTDHSLHPKSWNTEKWKRVVEEVCKQCQELYIPSVCEPINLKDWVAARSAESLLVFCDEKHREEKPNFQSQAPVDLLIGAEGGWSEAERVLIGEQKSMRLGLGNNRLRAETASLVALTLLKRELGEF